MIRAMEKWGKQTASFFTGINKSCYYSDMQEIVYNRMIYIQPCNITRWSQFDLVKLCLIWHLRDLGSRGLISPAVMKMWEKQVLNCIIPFLYNFKQSAPLQDCMLFLSSVHHIFA
jgi:hypothetical protein